VTYRGGLHPTRVGDWVEPADDAPPELADLVATFRYMRRAAPADRVPMEDVRATLEAMTRIEDDDEAASALAHCDAMTQAVLEMPMRRAFGSSVHGRLRAASRAALAGLKSGPGRPRNGYQVVLAEAVVDLWAARAPREPGARWEWRDAETELRSLGAQIFDLVERREFERRKLGELLRAAFERWGNFSP
jgi:hypothetical protein